MKYLLGALIIGVALSASAGRVVTQLDGNDWTLDGLPVLVPNSWNKLDGADGRADYSEVVRGDSSATFSSYARRLGVYRRALPDAKPGRRYFVRCGGACEVASLRVNGREVGSHEGAFTAFCLEITDALRPSGNELEIAVSNVYDAGIPPASGDFTMCGGLYRSVTLIETDPVCIDPTVDGASGVRVFAETNGEIRVEADVSGATDAVVEWTPRKVDNPELWSPENPKLYSLRVTVRKGEWSDTVEETFGFRTVEFREDGFYLNGVKRRARGVNRHQELAGCGWEMTPAQEERDIRLIKAMGADSVRLSHYPQSDGIYALCDRLGLMVWSEIPVVDRMTADGGRFAANALKALREMIAQHRNSPSVCWWGVFNELYNNFGEKDAPAEGAWESAVRRLADAARTLDPSRPVVAASNMPHRRDLNSIGDAIGYNIYPGWYFDGGMKEKVDEFISLNPLRPMGISEYGAGASVFHHANPAQRPEPGGRFHPEEHMTRVHMDCFRDIKPDDRLWCSFVWQMFDCASDLRGEGDSPGVNDKGLVTRDRVTAKDAYYLYKANWNPEPMLHLCGKRMTSTTNSVVDVVAFSNVGAVNLEVNGATVATTAPDEINAVVFRGVSLKPGANIIRVTAADLSDECTWGVEQKAYHPGR
jgi:beta-galactosidase